MNCKKINKKFVDFLTGEADPKTRHEIQAHLSECSSCREELESLSAAWTKLGVLPEEQPSNNLRTRFYTMLETYKQTLEQEKPAPGLKKLFVDWIERFWPRRPVFQFALSLLLLCAGLGGGYILNSGKQGTQQIAQLHEEVQNLRQEMTLSLLTQPSPSARLTGVSLTSQIKNPNAKTVEALLNTLDSDPNVNVRLAAVDALYLFSNYPQVRDGLIQSLSNQTSPLVQVSLINLLIEIRERRAADALKQLIRDEKLNPEVKQKAQAGLQQLI
jgi:anti-sigma factor RsiW